MTFDYEAVFPAVSALMIEMATNAEYATPLTDGVCTSAIVTYYLG